MKRARLYVLIFLTTIILVSILRLFDFESQRRSFKRDFIELSKAKYGIFNVDEWKIIIADIIISKKVEEFNLTDSNREVMRTKIESFLYKVLNESEGNFKKDKSGSLFGLIQKSVASVTDIFGHLKSEVPKITEDILNFMDDPENRNQIKKYLRNLIDKYADETFASVDYTILDEILARHDLSDKSEGLIIVQSGIVQIEKDSTIYNWALSFAVLVVFLIFLFGRELKRTEIIIGLMLGLFLLVAGVFMPMIDIDARIAMFSFSIMGEPVSFDNQVLYYKSKSILEVVNLLMSQGKLNVFFVGFLVLSFSVLFPLTKLFGSILYLFNSKWKELQWIQFFVFKSGKWSMADVMVVAIFMSYIGFSSILTEQLRQLHNLGKNLEILTTNQSTLNTGFYLFTAFVVIGLVISNRLVSYKN
jgi:hypothetical protein